MWTPRRVLIFVSALGAFLTAFVFYFLVFGVYDGLAPLPDRYLVMGPVPPPTSIEPEHRMRLRQAFGNECPELSRKSQTFLSGKGIVLAINEFKILKDGRVLLAPFSAGIFGKANGARRFPEINTIQCEEAYLTLDRPVTSLSDLSKSKLVAVELTGSTGVKLVNNRGSFEKHDDLELYVADNGKLFYEEIRNLIWTDDAVRLMDTQTQPLPTLVTALGMEVLLSKDTSPNAPKKEKAPPKKTDGASGVEKITLRSNVDMHLYLDARSGFMAGTEDLAKKEKEAKKPGPVAPPEKMHVQVTTNGKFVYDMIRDTARFDSPLTQGPLEDRVKVTRNLLAPKRGIAPVAAKRIDPVPVGLVPPMPLAPPTSSEATNKIDDFDVLICDHLDLQFRKKPAEKGAAKLPEKTPPPQQAVGGMMPGGEGGDKEIDFAIATADPTKTVRMKMVAEDMDADAIEMRYFAATAESGPRSILKGQPVIAYRQGHRIECPELHLKGADKNGNGQEGFAKGPGRLDLLDKTTGKRTTHVFWKNSLTSTKDKDGNRLFDLLTLRGEPAVIDDEKKQELKAAQFLHLWMEQVPDRTPGAREGATKQVPYKMEGFENVSARSPELIIHRTDHLTVLFAPEKPGSVAPAPTTTAIAPIKSAGPNDPAPQTTGRDKKDALPGLGDPQPKTAAAPEKKKDGKPIEITAGDITAFIAETNGKKELQEMLCREQVHIHQEPEAGKEKEKGLDITGKFVGLKHNPDGDILHVLGEGKKHAQLVFGEMLLFGRDVTIDQIMNRATVDGDGSLTMPSNKTLDGKPKEGRLTVYWSTQMVFNGSLANFDGNVQAIQDTGRLLSQSMQVTLDRPIDFKQGQRGDQKAAVDKIVCDSPAPKQVYVVDEERAPDGKLIAFKRLQLQVMEVNNKEQRMDGSASGVGGVLDFIGRGGGDDDPLKKPDQAKPRPKGSGPEEIVFKRTRIRFTGNMTSYMSATGNGRKTTFRQQVRVFHEPGSDPNAPDPEKPTKGSLFLQCERLDVTSRKVGEKTYQEMFADGVERLVNFQAEEFTGTAKTVKFDERDDIVIFEGAANVPVTIYKLPKVQGGPPQILQGGKILYNRKTGEFTIGDARVISSWLMPTEPTPLAFHIAPGLPGSRESLLGS